MRLENKSRYALLAMQYLNEKEFIPLECVVIKQDLPLAYLKRIFSKLAKSGLVHTQRGKNGGYKLAFSADYISLKDIMLAVGEKLIMTQCKGLGSCQISGEFCRAHNFWVRAENLVAKAFEKISLKEMRDL